MENKSSSLLSAAMYYGLPLGIYWVVKYLFFMLSLFYPVCVTVYWGMSLVVPYFAYLLTKRYREDLGGSISFFRAWQFGVMLYFFAGLIVSVAHYLFYQYVAPPDFLQASINQTIESIRQMQVDPKIVDAIKSLNISPIHMALQGIFNNVFYGIIFSIPVAGLICRNNQTGSAR